MIEPHYQDDWVTLYCADCVEVLPELSGASAVVTDPPYEINFMNKAFDRTGISFDSVFWRLLRDACLPGAHLLSFGGTRTFHRIACAIEDAGWEIRDTLTYMWCFGSGFPKSRDISKAIDAEAGVEREVLGISENSRPAQRKSGMSFDKAVGSDIPAIINLTAPATPAAKLWQGYGSALKPAFEPITLARKPLQSTIAGNCLEHGCGALNIDACRVIAEERKLLEHTGRNGNIYGSGLEGSRSIGTTTEGRWPSNMIHDGSPEVLAGFPESIDGGSPHGRNWDESNNDNPTRIARNVKSGVHFMDSGSAARFFYTAKASGEDRVNNPHPTVKPLALIKYLCQLVQQPERNLILDPFAGSGTTLVACKTLNIPVIGIEREERYCEIAVKRLGQEVLPLYNHHFRDADLEAANEFYEQMDLI